MLQALPLALAASLALRSGESVPRAPFATEQQALDGPFAFPSWGSGTAAQRGDLDGDGRDEVLLTGMEGRLALLRFAEDGWTVEPTDLPVLGQAHEVELADLDLDGSTDILVAAEAGLQVLWGDEAGRYSLPQLVAKGKCFTARAGDLNGDGLADILATMYLETSPVASDQTLPTGLIALLSTGQRSFLVTQARIRFGGYNDLALGDWNGDGKLDAAGGSTFTTDVLLGDGQGRMTTGASYAGGSELRLIARDLDGDGELDLARLGLELGLQPALYGASDGTFQAGGPIWPGYGTAPMQPPTYDLDAGDFDADGLADLLVIQAERPELYLGSAGQGFARSRPLPLPQATWAGTLADVDGDGALDVVAHNPLLSLNPAGKPQQGRLSILYGDGAGGLRGIRSASSDALTGLPVETTTGDLDGDGLPDLVQSLEWSAKGVLVLLSDGAGGWSGPIDHAQIGNLDRFRVGDVDGDGHGDLVGRLLPAGNLTAFLGDGAGGFGRANVTPLPAQQKVQEFELVDLDGDGRDDLVGRDVAPTIGALRVQMSRGAGYFGPPRHHPGLSFVHSFQAADLDLDGRTDLVVVQWKWTEGISRVLVLPGRGDGTFGAEVGVASFESWIPAVQIGDLDGDGLPDIAATSCRHGSAPVNEVVTFKASTPGVFASAVGTRTATIPQDLTLADLDGDGILDALTSAPTSDEVVLRGRGDGTFEAWCALGSPGELRAIADMDGDGRSDLVYADSVVLNRAR